MKLLCVLDTYRRCSPPLNVGKTGVEWDFQNTVVAAVLVGYPGAMINMYI
jgi:hypothetical protein